MWTYDPAWPIKFTAEARFVGAVYDLEWGRVRFLE